jgi:hypothetical protein
MGPISGCKFSISFSLKPWKEQNQANELHQPQPSNMKANKLPDPVEKPEHMKQKKTNNPDIF